MRTARSPPARDLCAEIAAARRNRGGRRRRPRRPRRGPRPRAGRGARSRSADAARQQCERVRAGRDRNARSRALRPSLRRQPARAGVPGRGLRRPSSPRARTPRSSTCSTSASSSRRRATYLMGSPRVPCMPRPRRSPRRWRRGCGSTRWRPGRPCRIPRQDAETFARAVPRPAARSRADARGDRRRRAVPCAARRASPGETIAVDGGQHLSWQVDPANDE